MKTKAFILANIALLALGVSSATSGPCSNEIDSLTKTLAAKDAGSGPTAGAAVGPQPAASASSQHPPTSIMGQQTQGGLRLPKTCVAKPKASRQPPSKEQPARPRQLTLHLRLAARWIVRVRSISRARKPNAWKPYERQSNTSALARHTA